MRTVTLITLILSLAFIGCQKQPTSTDLDTATTALEKSEEVLGIYLERLNSEFTAQEIRTQILCKDYPSEYEKNYIPNMLILNSEYTKAVLLSDLDRTLEYYKQRDQIQC